MTRFTPKQQEIIDGAPAFQSSRAPTMAKMTADQARYLVEYVSDCRPELENEATYNSETIAQQQFAIRQHRKMVDGLLHKLRSVALQEGRLT